MAIQDRHNSDSSLEPQGDNSLEWQFRTGTILIQASNRKATIRWGVWGTRLRECLASDGT